MGIFSEGCSRADTVYVREMEEKDQYAALVTVMKVAYLQALMNDRFQTYVPCNGDIATMTEMLRRVQAAAASAVD